MNAVTNLDRLAAEKAQAVIKNTNNQKASDVENTVTKALGVLQEDGVYACFLYLLAKEKDNGKAVVAEMLDLLEQLAFGWNKPMNNGKVNLGSEIVLKYITDNVTQNLEQLLLTKETLEQMLIYARYGAKARQVEEKNNEQEKTL
jgi:flavin-dependent dehydrogenase